MREAARAQDISLWDATRRQLAAGNLTGRARNALGAFVELIEMLRAEAGETDLGGIMGRIIKRSDLIQHYLAHSQSY